MMELSRDLKTNCEMMGERYDAPRCNFNQLKHSCHVARTAHFRGEAAKYSIVVQIGKASFASTRQLTMPLPVVVSLRWN
jgi:hypothetical protein